MTTTITTTSGQTATLPAHLDPAEVVGIDGSGRIVVFLDWMRTYAFGLTLCCKAFDKGVEDGIVCRSCYGDWDTGAYHDRLEDGTFLGVEPLA